MAIERAQSVETLEQRVKELDVLSSLGQASNFTRTLDDLLELISAQTNRLLKSDFQYIAFFDSEQEQLYFTFFLEEDERYNAREGRRWPLGNDIYSQILRSGEARRYEDYNREKQIGTFGTLYDSPRIRAWMGVPLVAQNRRLGVFALAKRDTIPYTADDMATFVNLSRPCRDGPRKGAVVRRGQRPRPSAPARSMKSASSLWPQRRGTSTRCFA
ncbi:MAG: GAF domain-containing protein [Chloroflexi bacterium]|nr:GAF domain-containing protein [Chloroflexota bacterium]